MNVFCAPDQQLRHYPRQFLVSGAPQPNPEEPERLERLLGAARQDGHDIREPVDHGLGPLAAVHTPQYLAFLSDIYERWQRIEGGSEEVIPNIHPNHRGVGYPRSAVGQAGYHMADTACPIGKSSWESIRWSANTAVSAAQHVKDGGSSSYALCRPPGHHAFADLAGGFCYLNNSAAAASVLRDVHPRVAIVDVDLHHGNGTQGIFYKRADVFTLSVHADPTRFYPFFWGYAEERGEGAGHGYNLNLPLPRGSSDDAFLEVLERGIRTLRGFAPTGLVVALGLDAFEGDPFGGLTVTTDGFARIGETLARLAIPTVIVQEGGYLCDALGENLKSFLAAFEAAHRLM